MTTVTSENERSVDPLTSVDNVTFGHGDIPIRESVSVDVDGGERE